MDRQQINSAVILLEWAIKELDHYLPEKGAESLMLTELVRLREELKIMAKWEGFWLDTNKHDGFVKSPQQWGKIKKLYSPEDLKKARRKDSFDPCFGFRPEFKGEHLEKFFTDNDMKF